MKTYREMLFALRRLSVGFLCLLAAVIVLTGCETAQVPMQPAVQRAGGVSIERIRISAITEFVPDVGSSTPMYVKTLIELFDASDSLVKVPCTFRFELYEFHPLSSDPRRRRLMIWPDQNLNDPDANDEHWNEFLRGYEFYLPLDFMPGQGKKYILEATCFADQRRYNDLFKVEVSAIKN
ncbi:MAG: hypothetical protein DRP56_03440 [Planctomycetota bacterium]|nr:MAG: hypothetical protein DRP56_03440 [Planctomycetota bacterium]RKY14215.1 MAG: hypothetical protein DRP52_00660 [Planctomycetota bacterium]